MTRSRKSARELLEQTLAEAEAGLARAVAAKNSTAEANIISRLHTIRSDYAALLEKEEPDEDPLTPAEVADAIVELVPGLDDAGVAAVRSALEDRVRRGPS